MIGSNGMAGMATMIEAPLPVVIFVAGLFVLGFLRLVCASIARAKFQEVLNLATALHDDPASSSADKAVIRSLVKTSTDTHTAKLGVLFLPLIPVMACYAMFDIGQKTEHSSVDELQAEADELEFAATADMAGVNKDDIKLWDDERLQRLSNLTWHLELLHSPVASSILGITFIPATALGLSMAVVLQSLKAGAKLFGATKSDAVTRLWMWLWSNRNRHA